jgi:hypothetical protein
MVAVSMTTLQDEHSEFDSREAMVSPYATRSQPTQEPI